MSSDGVEDNEVLSKRLPFTYGEGDEIFDNSPTEYDDPGNHHDGQLTAGAPEVKDQPPDSQPAWLKWRTFAQQSAGEIMYSRSRHLHILLRSTRLGCNLQQKKI